MMAGGSLTSGRTRWVLASVAGTVGVFALAALGGLVLLPYGQSDLKLAGLWDAICSAAGVPVARSSTAPIEPAFKTSGVVMVSGMLQHPGPESIGRGATLAQQCAICHGPSGNSDAQFPNLAGQYASVVYKQLQDFKAGVRTSAVMSPFAQHMSEQQIVDVAAYYAYLPRLPSIHGNDPVPQIVANGAPMRGIAPCGSCHGGLDSKVGSPWLDGQSATYIRAQLENFARNTRHNDISQQMRNVARQMKPDEMDAAAAFYAARSTTPRHLVTR